MNVSTVISADSRSLNIPMLMVSYANFSTKLITITQFEETLVKNKLARVNFSTRTLFVSVDQRTWHWSGNLLAVKHRV